MIGHSADGAPRGLRAAIRTDKHTKNLQVRISDNADECRAYGEVLHSETSVEGSN